MGTTPAPTRTAFTLPILSGPMRGMWWAPNAGGKVARIFLGTYERAQTESFCRHLDGDSVLIDIGANAGYYTLLAARMTGESGRVIACEPDPAIAGFLRRHVAVNRLNNVTVLETAVGASLCRIGFSHGSGTGTGHVSFKGEIDVQMQTLDHIVANANVAPTHVKIDVEGAEVDVLRGGMDTLRRYKPVIFLSTHGADIHHKCCELLRENGFTLTPIGETPIETTDELLAMAA